MKHVLIAGVALWLGCQKPSSPPPPPAGPAFEALESPSDAQLLIDAGKAKVQSGDPTAPVLLKGSWRWRPADQELRIWTLCQGDMDAQGCVLFVGKIGQVAEVLEDERVGWAPPKVREAEGGLLIEGEDGRSSFTRTLRYEGGRPVIGPDQRPEGA